MTTSLPTQLLALRRQSRLFIGGLCLTLCLSVYVAPARSKPSKKPRVGVMVFAREGVSERLRSQFEQKLRAMVQYADAQGLAKGRLYPMEFFFDVGELSKANLVTSERHFNDAQRALEANDFDEAKDQLFRAKRFYMKGVPFVRDEPLLQSIFYFDYITQKNLKKLEIARDLYCQYVSLSRNLTGSVGPIEQYESLADLCGESPISGTAELRLSANVNGGHIYINNVHVGVIDSSTPFVSPFMAAGVHLVEVRKLGFARWGKLITLKNGRSKKLRARLKTAKNNVKDFQPLNQLHLRGPEAYSETYLAEFFYEAAYKFGIDTFLAVYLESSGASSVRATFFTFRKENLEKRYEIRFSSESRNGYYEALEKYWKKYFQSTLKPAEARETSQRWQPTFFKVE